MNRVCSERKLKGWTQEDFAYRVEVDPSTVVRWEKGGSIHQDKLARMRRLFCCDVDWLLGLSSERRTVDEMDDSKAS